MESKLTLSTPIKTTVTNTNPLAFSIGSIWIPIL